MDTINFSVSHDNMAEFKVKNTFFTRVPVARRDAGVIFFRGKFVFAVFNLECIKQFGDEQTYVSKSLFIAI